MKIMIVRHGEPDYSIDSLTEKGWREARLLSERLTKLDIADFYVSPLGRAQDTARPTLEKLGREAEILPWLQEFRGVIIDPSTGERKISWNLMPQYWTNQREMYDKDGWRDNGLLQTGNAAEIYEETARGFDALMARHGYVREGALWRVQENSDKTIVIFCHFALEMTLLSYIFGISPVVMWHSFFLPPSSVTTLVTEERSKGTVFFRCAGMGDISHLYAGNEPMSKMGLFVERYEDGDTRESL